MSIREKLEYRWQQIKPRLTPSTVYARPLPLIADESPPAGEDFYFKTVFDPTDRHLVELEGEERMEIMKPFFARGGFVELAIHKPTDQAVCKMWLLTYSPTPDDAKRGLLPIRLAKDECFMVDLWTHPDFRRQSVAFTLAYELGLAVDKYYPHKRWVYGYALEDNQASKNLMGLVYGMWPIQEITEIAVGKMWVTKLPFSDKPKYGPFSRRGRHSGASFNLPGRPRSGELYRNYHHPEGFLLAEPNSVLCNDWMTVGDEWFDNDHPLDAEGNKALPDTLRRKVDEKASSKT